MGGNFLGWVGLTYNYIGRVDSTCRRLSKTGIKRECESTVADIDIYEASANLANAVPRAGK